MKPHEASLADCVPLWRILREDGVTALVTPALDYVGGFELGCLDARFVADETLEGIGEALRSLLAGLDDGCTLHFLYRVTDDVEDDIRDYERTAGARAAESGASSTLAPALRSYVEARARWLRSQSLRKVRLQLFFTPTRGQSSLARGQLGVRLLTADLSRLTAEAHLARLKALANLRNALHTRLGQVGISARELSVDELQRVHHALLNPNRVRSPDTTGQPMPVGDNLWDAATGARVGDHLRELTEAEQLVREDLVEAQGHLRQEKTFRRALTLKVLPEDGTCCFNAEPLLGLASQSADGEAAPFPYWLSVTVHLEAQGRTRWMLSTQHGLVDALKNAVPFLADHSVATQARDHAKQRGIQALFEELHAMSSKLVTLSVTLLLDAPSIDALDARSRPPETASCCSKKSPSSPPSSRCCPGRGRTSCAGRPAPRGTRPTSFPSSLPGAGLPGPRRSSSPLRGTCFDSTSSTRRWHPRTTGWWWPTPAAASRSPWGRSPSTRWRVGWTPS
jgi:hypothetical protein